MTRVMSVTGPVEAADLGVTLTHEHIVNDVTSWSHRTESRGWDPDDLAHHPVTEEILWDLRHDPFANLDNCRLDDLEVAVGEVRRYAELGGRTLLEARGSESDATYGRCRRLADERARRSSPELATTWTPRSRTQSRGCTPRRSRSTSWTTWRTVKRASSRDSSERSASASHSPAPRKQACGAPSWPSARPTSLFRCTCRAGSAPGTECSILPKSTAWIRRTSCSVTWARRAPTATTRSGCAMRCLRSVRHDRDGGLLRRPGRPVPLGRGERALVGAPGGARVRRPTPDVAGHLPQVVVAPPRRPWLLHTSSSTSFLAWFASDWTTTV